MLQAYNSTNDIVTRCRSLRNTCTIGVAVAELAFAVLSVIVWGSVFFTVGILFYAVVGVINTMQSGGGSISQQQADAFNRFCSNGFNACTAVKGTFAWAATWFLFGWLFPLVQIVLASILMCQHNSLASIVSAKLTPPPSSGATTVVMMPAGMGTVMQQQPGVQVISGGVMIGGGGGGQVMMIGGAGSGQGNVMVLPQAQQGYAHYAQPQQHYGDPQPPQHVPTAQPVAYAQPVASAYNPAAMPAPHGAYGQVRPMGHPMPMPMPMHAPAASGMPMHHHQHAYSSDVPNKTI